MLLYRSLYLLGCLAAVALPSVLHAAISGDSTPIEVRYRDDRIVVLFTPEVARAIAVLGDDRRVRRLGVSRVDAVARSAGITAFAREFAGELSVSGRSPLAAFWLADLEADADPHAAAAAMRELPEVASADPVAILPVAAVPNDSLWVNAYHLFQPGRRDIHATEAWDITTGDPSIIVAILDTGVLPWHPDLGGTTPASRGQFWVNETEENGVAGVDDDGNGYVDDTWGWDFVDLSSNSGLRAQEDWADQDPDPDDLAGHGTAVAGLVAAATNNTIGISGVAWNARLMAARVGWASNRAPLGEVDMVAAAQAIVYAYRNGAQIINCSFATVNQPDLVAAALAATDAGALLVVAAGNSGTPHSLNDLDETLSVSALDRNDKVTQFSNRGPYVDIAAAGVGLPTTFLSIDGPDSVSARTPTYTSDATGTSFAAPIVAGAAALVQSQRVEDALPLLTPLELRLRLQDTSDDIELKNLDFPGYGAGRVNVASALERRMSSIARSGGSRTVGAPVVTPAQSGGSRAWFLTERGELSAFDGTTGDRVESFALGGIPTGGLASAYMGPRIGTAFVFALQDARIAAVDTRGRPLPGWPVTATRANRSRLLTPSIGDLDGDGVPEVVWPGDDGSIWAWTIDGKRVPGFPRAVGGVQDNARVALAQLDAEPGVEIVALTSAGVMHVITGGAVSLAGWPANTGVTPVSMGVASTAGGPLIAVSVGSEVQAWSPDGTRAWSRTIGFPAVADLAIGDLDDDGNDEIVVPTISRIEILDVNGALWGRPWWPKDVDGLTVAPTIIGALHPSGAPGIMTGVKAEPSGVHLIAFTTQAIAMPRWPLPGRAGQRVSLVDSDGDGATEVWAGSAPDSMLFVYDAGASTWSAAAQHWPTSGGNEARTYSRTYSPPAPVFDNVAPSAVADLAVTRTGRDVQIAWSAAADAGPEGYAVRYQIRAGPAPFDASTFDGQPHAWTVESDASTGSAQSLTVSDLDPRGSYVLALIAEDVTGNRSALSNTVTLGQALVGPTRLKTAVQPSRGTVTFQWEVGAGGVISDSRIQIYDGAGRLLRELALDAGTSGSSGWDGRDQAGRVVRPGLYFARLRSGSTEARARVVFLR